MKKIRILQVVSVLDMGGIETMLVNYLKQIDKTKFQIDFLVHREHAGFYDEYVKSLGSRIHVGPRIDMKSYRSYQAWSTTFFKEHSYDIVHSHLDALSFFPLFGAMKNGVPVRIAHSHVNNFDKDFKYPIRAFFQKKIPNVVTNYAACSHAAGQFMFPKANDVHVIVNPVDIDDFAYDTLKRNKLEEQLGIKSNQFVIGHVGRFVTAKNHKFIVEMISRFVDSNVVFVLVGDGPLLQNIKKLTSDFKTPKVIFTGVIENVSDYYSLFDVFVLPSLYEGLGNVAVEAQVAGLPVLISEGVNKDIAITDQVIRLPLKIDRWIQGVRDASARCLSLNPKLFKYNTEGATKELERYYLELVSNLGENV